MLVSDGTSKPILCTIRAAQLLHQTCLFCVVVTDLQILPDCCPQCMFAVSKGHLHSDSAANSRSFPYCPKVMKLLTAKTLWQARLRPSFQPHFGKPSCSMDHALPGAPSTLIISTQPLVAGCPVCDTGPGPQPPTTTRVLPSVPPNSRLVRWAKGSWKVFRTCPSGDISSILASL